MILITLLDGTRLKFKNPVSGYEVGLSISKALAESSYVMYVNGALWDLDRKIEEAAKVELVTARNTEVVLSILRHDMAHILAEAVLELFPKVKLGVGPATEYGFFYDFFSEQPFSLSDLEKIESRMREIIDRDEKIQRYVLSQNEAKEKLEKQNEFLKLEILENIEDDNVTFYKQGAFEDLCRGPHVRSTAQIPKAFKLTKLSSVYWQGKVEAPSLQRITGIGFLTQKDLDNHLLQQDELAKYDHRKLGRDMQLFHLQDEAAGSIFWHNNGCILYRLLENYIRAMLDSHGYQEVKTPILVSEVLWERSGHLSEFRENMFAVENKEVPLAIKPMNCPLHIEIFKSQLKSYKDLPIRMAEFGCCHRNEPSGSLHGLLRVRSFTQDDAHIFCTPNQVQEEVVAFCQLLKRVYNEIFGDIDILVKFSDRPEKRVGSESDWDMAEQSLMQAAKSAGIDPIMNKGEGAFYGPKLEFTINDSFGRNWQLGTIQVDYILPERLGASYIDAEDNKKTPVVLHRAILGSLERFIGILVEHYRGRLPFWLSPCQVVIATVSTHIDPYAVELEELLTKHGIRCLLDNRGKTLNYKIRESELNKIPVILVIGDRESMDRSVTIRLSGNKQQNKVKFDQLVKILLHHNNMKTIDLNMQQFMEGIFG